MQVLSDEHVLQFEVAYLLHISHISIEELVGVETITAPVRQEIHVVLKEGLPAIILQAPQLSEQLIHVPFWLSA